MLMNLNEFNEMNDNDDLFLNSKNIINSSKLVNWI